MKPTFETGKQPCAAFYPRDDGFGMGNLHDCYGPYDAQGHVPGAPYCGSKVSLCENCLSDHHAGGWQTCGHKVERPKNPPPAHLA
jgi:hypothetical protein